MDTTLNFGASIQTIAGKDVYLFDGTDPVFSDIKNEQALALVDDMGRTTRTGFSISSPLIVRLRKRPFS